MIVKYQLSSQVLDNTTTDVKWIVANSITDLATINTHQFNSRVIAKGTPFTIEVPASYRLRYLAIESDNQFTISYNEGPEFITKVEIRDFGIDRTGFTGLVDLVSLTLTNPTGAAGPVGNQFSNPTDIIVRYLVVLEKLT